MSLRGLPLLVLWSIAGCHLLSPLEKVEKNSPAEEAWRQGQQAMRRGQPREAIGLYRRTLDANPQRTETYLSLAAAHLEAGEDAPAAESLERYLAAHPENLAMRMYLAELLLRLHRPEDARAEFERYSHSAQEQPDVEGPSLIHCQRRLMEIAEVGEDEYGEHLHRGIGLYLLARRREALPDAEDALPVEGLLCKAAAELTLAHRERPERARPSWYLYLVWSRLEQRHAALRSLFEADASAAAFDLTPAERRVLEMAWRQHGAEGRKKS